MAMANKRPSSADPPEVDASRPVVTLPGPEGDKPAWGKVGLLSAIGLAIGLGWPVLAGVRVGPDLPGSKTPEVASAPSPEPIEAPTAEPSAVPALAKPAGDHPKPVTTQTVVVGGGRIVRCFRGRKAVEHAEECGALDIDKIFVPRLKDLTGCPHGLGLAGELELGFDIDFDKKEISVVQGDKSDMPSITINGIMACAADYIRNVEPEKIGHKFSRYKVIYDLKFYPPGTAPPTQGIDEAAPQESDAERGLASVSWDTALIRDEPRSGKVVARLVRGTRVKILSRRDDWYRVKIRSKEGWVYRGALGL
jgi:hypothetical protein